MNLVRSAYADAFGSEIAHAYAQTIGVSPEIYLCEPAQGAGPWIASVSVNSGGSMSNMNSRERNVIYEAPHRRLNPLTGEWILVSPHRSERPWRGQTERAPSAVGVVYDPNCYLCPGNTRAGGIRNPDYTSTFVFTNDFAALTPDVRPASQDSSGHDLLRSESEPGTCRVVCFSPRHDLTLARMEVKEIRAVLDVWANQFAELGSLPYINYVQIFENRGEMMGCSNPHPHGQIWANRTIPNEPRKEQESQFAYSAKYGSCLLCDYLKVETSSRPRVVPRE